MLTAGHLLLNRWLIEEVKAGGMGIIYVVYDRHLEARFVAKTYSDAFYRACPDAAWLFIRECVNWINLDLHPCIVGAHWVHFNGDKPIVFADYVPGETLGRRIAEGPMPLNECLLFALQCCDALCHMSSKGVIAHGDLKPNNCIVSDLDLRVTDFGLSQAFATASEGRRGAIAHLPNDAVGHSEEKHHTCYDATRCVLGSAPYMAPERFNNPGFAEAAWDTYALGAIVFEMLAGRPPFKSATWSDYALAHASEPIPRLPSATEQVDRIIRLCLQKNPSKRIGDFHVLRDHLASAYTDATGLFAPHRCVDISDGLFAGGLIRPERKVFALPPKFAPSREQVTYFLSADRWNNKAVSLSRLGEFESALDCYERALGMRPDSAVLWNNRGALLWKIGRRAEALASFERAEFLEPENPLVRLNLSNLLKGGAGPRDATQYLKREFEVDPGLNEIRAVRIGVAANEGSDKILDPYCDRAGVSMLASICNSWAERDPPISGADWINRGADLASNGCAEEALACYERGLALDESLADGWYNRALVLLELDRTAEAEASINCSLRLEPGLHDGYWLKGSVHLAQGRLEYSLSCFSRELARDSKHLWSLCDRSINLVRLGQYGEAIRDLDRLITLEPFNARAFQMRGEILMSHLDLPVDGLRDFQEAHRLGLAEAVDLIVRAERCIQG